MRIKDRLAKLLATENVTVRHSADVRTASFDIKDRVLTLPILKDMGVDITDLMVGHEVGHALYTPVDGWEFAIKEDGVNQNILNIVEDPRIEKLVKRKYPGLRKAFLSGYRSLMEQGFFGDNLDFATMNVLDRLNMHFKGGASLQVPFDNAELWMIEDIEACESFTEVVIVAKKIQMAYSELLNQSMDSVMDTLGMGSGDSDDWGDDMPGEWDDTPLPNASETLDGDSIDSDNFNAVSHKVDDDEASTVEEWERKQADLVKSNPNEVFYIGLPKPIIKNVVIPHKKVRTELSKRIELSLGRIDTEAFRNHFGFDPEDWKPATIQASYNKFRSSSQKIINYMVKEFERKKAADEYKRVSVDKTGILNVTKLHEYKYNDDLFLKRAIVHDGKNHGLVFLLDWSASMTYHMENTVKQLLSLVWFCNKVNVPFEVYAFTSAYYDAEVSDSLRLAREIMNPPFESKHGEVVFNDRSGFRLLNMLSSRMSARELNEQALNLFTVGYANGKRRGRLLSLGQYEMGSTPLGEALVVMQEIIPNFRNYHKLDKVNFICLTDGEANSSFGSIRNDYDADLEKDDRRAYTPIPSSYKVDVIFDDPKSRKTYHVNNPSRRNLRMYDGEEQCAFLLRLLKDRYDINTIGIFLDSNRSLGRGLLEKYLGWHSMNRAAHKKARKDCRTNGFAVVRSAGFDEYYLVPSGSVLINDETGLSIEAGEAATMKKGQLRSLFAKNQKKKFGNRIMVNRMMDLIT